MIHGLLLPEMAVLGLIEPLPVKFWMGASHIWLDPTSRRGVAFFCFYVKSTQNVPKLDEIEINFSAIHRPQIILTIKQKETEWPK